MNESSETAKKSIAAGQSPSSLGVQFTVTSTIMGLGRSPEERRAFPRARLDCILYVSLRSGNGGIVLDISEAGLALHAAGPLSASDPIEFRFLVPPIGKLEISGEMVWVDETRKRCGIRFIDLPEKVRQEIRRWASPGELPPAKSRAAEVRGKLSASQSPAVQASKLQSTIHAEATTDGRAAEAEALNLTARAAALAPQPESAKVEWPAAATANASATEVLTGDLLEAPPLVAWENSSATWEAVTIAKPASGEPDGPADGAKADAMGGRSDSRAAIELDGDDSLFLGGRAAVESPADCPTPPVDSLSTAGDAESESSADWAAAPLGHAASPSADETSGSATPASISADTNSTDATLLEARPPDSTAFHLAETDSPEFADQSTTVRDFSHEIDADTAFSGFRGGEWSREEGNAIPDESWRGYTAELRTDTKRRLLKIGMLAAAVLVVLLFTHRISVGHSLITAGAKLSGARVIVSDGHGAESSPAAPLAHASAGLRSGEMVTYDSGAAPRSTGAGADADGGTSRASDRLETAVKASGALALGQAIERLPEESPSRENAGSALPIASALAPTSTKRENGQAELKLARQYLLEADSGETTSPAAELLWLAVEKGNTDAEIDLADLYGRGDGVQKNCEQARILLNAVSQSSDPYVRGKAAAEMNILGCK